HDAAPIAPAVADGIAVRWLDPAAPWAAQVGAVPTSATFAAGIVATAELLFDDEQADLRQTETFECVLFPLGDPPDIASLVAVDHDPRDLREDAPNGSSYLIPDAKLKTKALFAGVQKGIVDHLLVNRTVTLLTNRDLKLSSRPGETAEAFTARCEAAADAEADKQTAAMARRYETRVQRARAALTAAHDRVEEAEAAKESRRNDELVSGAGDLLGSIFGGRRSGRSIAGKVGQVARRRGRTSEAAKRVATASNRVEEKSQALLDLEADMADELAGIVDEWEARASNVQTIDVPLERSDIRVTTLALVWIPVA
ncbi:MAG: hypothetical protein ACRDZU_14655, partial [Acidimicrobiales bacterium]